MQIGQDVQVRIDSVEVTGHFVLKIGIECGKHHPDRQVKPRFYSTQALSSAAAEILRPRRLRLR